MNRLLFVGPLVFALISCFPSLDAPVPPDLDGLVAQYEAPTAEVTSEVLAQSVTQISERLTEVEELGLSEELLSVINAVQSGTDSDPNDSKEPSIGGQSLGGVDGVFDVRRTCPGWEDDALPDPLETGTLFMTLLLVGGEFDRVVFGNADQCEYVSEGSQSDLLVRFTGEFEADLERPLPVGEVLSGLDIALGSRALTVQYSGNATVGAITSEVEGNFRNVPGQQTEVSIVLDESQRNFVFFLSDDGVTQGLRDSTGSFTCSLEERRCENDSGVFTW